MSAEAGKTALITGASSGIGAAFARQLAMQGYGLILVARRGDRLLELAGKLANNAVPIKTLTADLTVDADLQQVEDLIASSEALDLLVNNAGFSFSGPFTKNPFERHAQMIQVHVIASVRLAHAALPAMMARQKGGIINVASVAAFIPWGNVTYNATKAYLVAFSESLQADVHHSGVRVQALCPGFTVTEFHDSPELASIRRVPLPGFLWLNADYVVQESLKALDRNKVICIPGLPYRLIVALGRSSLTGPIVRAVALRLRSRSRH